MSGIRFSCAARIGYAIQDVGLFPHYTVWENVALVPKLEKWDPQRIADRVEEVLRLVGLPSGEFGQRYPNQLSGGQRQRVGLARALAAEPPILLMDEPFGALDPITRAEIQMEFKKLQQELGKTIVFVTHDVGEALMLGDRIAVMEAGQHADHSYAGRVSASRLTRWCRNTWRSIARQASCFEIEDARLACISGRTLLELADEAVQKD